MCCGSGAIIPPYSDLDISKIQYNMVDGVNKPNSTCGDNERSRLAGNELRS